MNRMTQSSLLIFSVALLAADPAWKTKPVSQWNKQDAAQILANSPWVRRVTPAILPQRSEAQLRDGGQMGGGKGVNLDDIGASALTGIGGNRRAARSTSKPGTMQIRWESSVAVRTAELKSGESDTPGWDGSYYAIAVYDVPGLADVNPKTLSTDLKKQAFLKRDGKKDAKPARVEVALLDSGDLRVVYLFPRTSAISVNDQQVGFVAQIGRLYLAYTFVTGEMQLQGKVDL
jgi:hypothetical protein